MSMKTASAIAFGIFGAAASFSCSAQTAVSILGNSPAVACFHTAEKGGDARAGIADCTVALNTALSVSDRAATYVNRGVLELDLHQVDAALADINNGIQISPGLGDAYVDRGAVAISQGRYDEAMADLNKALELGAHYPQIAYYDRGIVFEQKGDIRSAYYDYRKAVEIAPDFTRAVDELKRFRVVHKDGA